MTREKIAVLDWNGCLLDDFFVAHTAMNRILHANNRAEVTEEEYRNKFDMPFDKLYGAFGFKTIPENGQQIYGETVKTLGPQTTLRKDAGAFLKITRDMGAKNIILSNSRCASIKSKLEENKLDMLVHDIIGIDHPQFNSTNKSDNLAGYLANKNADTIFIGDTFEEIDMATRFKGTSMAITGGYISQNRLAARNPDFVIKNFYEALGIMGGMQFLDHTYKLKG